MRLPAQHPTFIRTPRFFRRGAVPKVHTLVHNSFATNQQPATSNQQPLFHPFFSSWTASARRCFLGLLLLAAAAVGVRAADTTEVNFEDFNDQGLFNNFAGDNGTFAAKGASINASFETRVFHGPSGASLRLDYSVTNGFCGLWYSLLGKASFSRYTLNFTNLYGLLRNSTGNPSRVENIRVRKFSFWARGDGNGQFDHKIKIEFKNSDKLLGSALFPVSNSTNWTRCDVDIDQLAAVDLSKVKEVVFVIEDWQNDKRVGRIYLDDLSFTTSEPSYNASHWSDDAMLDLVAQRAFLYFLVFTDDLGFALDRSTYSDMVSTGTIGFQLAAYCIGHRRGWVDRAEVENRVVTILKNLRDLPMGPEPGTVRSGYRGFYYHFLTANTGLRKDDHVELSLYDTMLLMYGVLTCREYFTTNPQIQKLSQELFDRVEWNWFVDKAPGINSNRFYLAWQPSPGGNGLFVKHVDGQTDEAFMVDVLAMGSGTHPTSIESYAARNRVYGSYPPSSRRTIMVSWKGSLFNYFFASCWFNFADRGLDLYPNGPRDLWENNRLAILANRRFCIDHSATRPGGVDGQYATYGETAWGLTACDNLVPPSRGVPGDYFSFGALPTEENLRFGTKANHSGTLAVYGAAGCINFVPQESIAALRHDFEIPGLWNPLFGFGDSYSLDPHFLSAPYDARGNPTIHFADYLNGPWVNHMIMGINVGPMLLAIENYRSHFLWNLMAKNPEVSAGMDTVFGAAKGPQVAISFDRNSDRPRVNLNWKSEPGVNAYNIYSSTDLENWNLRKNAVTDTAWTDNELTASAQRFYQVKGLRTP